MKLITATMANNIANDFLGNLCGSFIKDTMSKILIAAERGKHEISVYPPCSWSTNTIESCALFLMGLGYQVKVHCSSMSIIW
jgi:hypothetical protein